MKHSESPTIKTYTGRHVDLLNPSADVIHIDDIAHAFSLANRFTGHTLRPYTVAEHLLLGVELCLPEHRFKWFTHDFSEAYLGDMAGPMKRMLGMQFYRDLEKSWEIEIAARFGIPAKGAADVKTIDGRMLSTEQRDLCGRMPVSTDRFKPFALHIGPVSMSPAHLKEQFLAQFYELATRTDGARI
jgi:hypothetical protein